MEKRYNTAQDWITAAFGDTVDQDIIETLANCCLKKTDSRGPIWRLRKTDPKTGPEYFVYKAFKFARHAATWGNLACWNEGFTGRLLMADYAEREIFNRAFDQFTDFAKTR